jgi:hypothetical protein
MKFNYNYRIHMGIFFSLLSLFQFVYFIKYLDNSLFYLNNSIESLIIVSVICLIWLYPSYNRLMNIDLEDKIVYNIMMRK